jgi:glyoxylase-like metal-dependent hydrolase (beta-lactamase superfamily II)
MITVSVFTFNPVDENTYVLFSEKDACCIIDPGCYFGNERRTLEEYIEQEGLTPKYLLNTHCHLDHVFGNKFIHDRYGLTLHLHQNEKIVLDHAPAAGLQWNMPFENYRGNCVYLKEGDLIHLGDDVLEVLFTPGHSPGSICFYCRAQQFIVSGDVLFRMSIGRTDLPGGDPETLMDSLREKLWTLPDGVKVYPGHGEPTTIGYEKKHNPFIKVQA